MSGIMLAAAIGAAFSVTLNPANVSTAGGFGGHVAAMTAIPAGGTGAYTYAWTVVQNDSAYILTISSPAAATTDFNFAPLSGGDIASARVRCTVTDTGSGASAFAEGYVTRVNNTQRSPGGGVGVIR